jgi:hypothetical protein
VLCADVPSREARVADLGVLVDVEADCEGAQSLRRLLRSERRDRARINAAREQAAEWDICCQMNARRVAERSLHGLDRLGAAGTSGARVVD